MKILSDGGTFSLVTDDVAVLDALPAGMYAIQFKQSRGNYFERLPDPAAPEPLYGKLAGKPEKVMSAFARRDGTTGVILSGDKGLGKSLFTRHVCRMAVDAGYPVICVRSQVTGLMDVLYAMRQPCVLLFDEFEKVFCAAGDSSAEEMRADAQTPFLSLLDGTGCGRRLVMVTCNMPGRLSQYFLDRPGRFLYHLSAEYPGPEDIARYMADRGVTQDSADIGRLVRYACCVPLNYDSLDAIAGELLAGDSLDGIFDDLNIRRNLTRGTGIEVTLHAGGVKYIQYYSGNDLREDGSAFVVMTSSDGEESQPEIEVRIAPGGLRAGASDGLLIPVPGGVAVNWCRGDEVPQELRGRPVDYDRLDIRIRRQAEVPSAYRMLTGPQAP